MNALSLWTSPCNSDPDEDSNDLDPTGNAYFKFEFSRVEVIKDYNEGDGSGGTHIGKSA